MKKALVIALSWMTSTALAAAYLLIGRGIDDILAHTAPKWTLIAAAVLVLVSAVCSAAVIVRCSRDFVAAEDELHHRLLAQIFALGPIKRSTERSGRLVSTITDGVERNATHTETFAGPMIASLTTPVIVVAFIVATIDAMVGALLALSIPIVPLSVAGFQAVLKPVSKRHRTATRALAAQELDAIQGLSTLSLINGGKRMGRVLEDAAEKARASVMRLLAGNQLVLFVVDAVFSLGMLTAAAALAMWRMNVGAISPGQAIALVLLSSIMLDPLDRIGQFFYIGMGGIAAGREIRELLAEEAPAVDAPGVIAPRSLEPTIDVSDVRFGWNEGVPVLRGVDLHIGEGEHVALVGASGAGKSTLSALLQAHVRPDSGTISVGGVDLAAVPLAWWRARLGVVEQSTYLFTGTLRDNLLIARPDATEDELKSALDRARLTELLGRLPEGLDTPIGERGLALSGGEAQRLAIARAILKDAPLLLLDEPTAHVDLVAEREILAALDDVTAGRTTLTITHRTATMNHADRIVELSEGSLR